MKRNDVGGRAAQHTMSSRIDSPGVSIMEDNFHYLITLFDYWQRRFEEGFFITGKCTSITGCPAIEVHYKLKITYSLNGDSGHSISGATLTSMRFRRTRYFFHSVSKIVSLSVAMSKSTASCNGKIA